MKIVRPKILTKEERWVRHLSKSSAFCSVPAEAHNNSKVVCMNCWVASKVTVMDQDRAIDPETEDLEEMGEEKHDEEFGPDNQDD